MGHKFDLTGDGGVLKQIVTKAKTDAIRPTKYLPLVKVRCKSSLDGTIFVPYDTSEEEDQITFRIGMGLVIIGLDIGVRTMKVGEIARFTIKPDYAYGEKGIPQEIPPNATMHFEVELMACRPWLSARSSAARLGKERMMRCAEAEKRIEEVVDVEYDIKGDRQLLKKIIRKGEAGAIEPTPGMALVDVLCNGFVVKLVTGEVFDFTCGDHTLLEDDRILKDGILTLDLRSAYVMSGWVVALRTMKVGDIATITCKSDYAFGDEGLPPKIPPYTTVISTLKLVNCRAYASASPQELEKLKELKKLRKMRDASRAAMRKMRDASRAAMDPAATEREYNKWDFVSAADAAAAEWEEKKAAAAAAAAEWEEKKAAWEAAAAAAAQLYSKNNQKKKRKRAKEIFIFTSLLKDLPIYNI